MIGRREKMRHCPARTIRVTCRPAPSGRRTESTSSTAAPRPRPVSAGRSKPTYANDPNETQIQYDLYKIPFNGGKGGKAVPVLGASANGMSNDFPKVSPDGRWIVFVRTTTACSCAPTASSTSFPSRAARRA